MRTLSQISEDLYQLEQRMISGGERPALDAYATLVQIRQDLEPHITSPAHDTPGEGTEHYSLDGSPTEP